MIEFSGNVVGKARDVLAVKGAVCQDSQHPAVWWVTGSRGGTYRVQTDLNPVTRTLTWVTCTCPHGLHAGAGQTHCYHACAVLLRLREALIRVPWDLDQREEAFAERIGADRAGRGVLREEELAQALLAEVYAAVDAQPWSTEEALRRLLLDERGETP